MESARPIPQAAACPIWHTAFVLELRCKPCVLLALRRKARFTYILATLGLCGQFCPLNALHLSHWLRPLWHAAPRRTLWWRSGTPPAGTGPFLLHENGCERRRAALLPDTPAYQPTG